MYIKREPLGRGNLSFRKRRRRFPVFGIILYLLILAVAVYVFLNMQDIQPRIMAAMGPEPTPTMALIEYQTLAEDQYQSGDLMEAAVFYRQAAQLEPTNLDIKFELARILTLTAQLESPSQNQQVADNLEEALLLADEMILLAPEDPRGHAVKSRALDYVGNVQEAAVEALRAIELDPDYALGHAYLAEAYADLGQLRQAREHAQLAIEIDPFSIDTRRNYAYVLEFYGDYGGAVQQYMQAIQIHDNLLDLWYGLARNYRGMGDYEQSEATYRQIIRRTPDEPRPYVELGRTYFEIRNDDGAQGTLEQAVRLVCEDCPLHTYEELERQDFIIAESQLPEVIYEPAWRRLGQVYHTRRNFEDAIAIYEELVSWYDTRDLEPPIEAFIVLASDYYYLDRAQDGSPLCDRAITYAERALDIYERDRVNDSIMLTNILSVYVLCRDYAITPPSQPVQFPDRYEEPDVVVQRPGSDTDESGDGQ